MKTSNLVQFYLGDSATMPFTRWQWCDDVSKRIDHMGWFCDEFQDNKMRGIVVRLANGTFVAGYSMGDHMTSTVDTGTVYTNDCECARAADSMAENAADTEREYQAIWQAARKLEDENQNAITRLRECIVLRNRKCVDYVRSEISELCETIRTNRARLAGEFADYA